MSEDAQIIRYWVSRDTSPLYISSYATTVNADTNLLTKGRLLERIEVGVSDDFLESKYKYSYENYDRSNTTVLVFASLLLVAGLYGMIRILVSIFK